MFQPQNVVITCSKSGKLTTSLVYYWRDKVLAPNCPSTRPNPSVVVPIDAEFDSAYSTTI